jgi:hypothetical protein
VRACCPSALIEGSLEVGEHQDVEQLGAGGAEGVQALGDYGVNGSRGTFSVLTRRDNRLKVQRQ